MTMSYNAARKWLLYTAILLLPFTWELVFNVGFPLKIYEIFFAVVLAAALFYPGEWIPVIRDRTVRLLLVFLAVVVMTGVWGVTILNQTPEFPVWAVGRDHPYLSILYETGYLIFDAAVLVLVAGQARDRQELGRMMQLLTIAGTLAALYGIFQVLLYYAGNAGLHLPSMPDRKPLFDYIIPRITSFFKEPNYLAGFIVCIIPFVIGSFYQPGGNRYLSVGALAVLCCALYLTFSTGGWLIFFFIAAYLLWRLRGINRRTTLILAVSLGAAVMILLAAEPRIFYDVIWDKLFGRFINPNTISRLQRKEQIINAVILFFKYPVTGVGLSNYGIVADRVFNLNTSFNLTVNNIYFELLAETGLVGLALFLLFLWQLFADFKNSPADERERVRHYSLQASFFSLVIMLNFYPSHSLTFIWVLLGLYLGYLMSRETG